MITLSRHYPRQPQTIMYHTQKQHYKIHSGGLEVASFVLFASKSSEPKRQYDLSWILVTNIKVHTRSRVYILEHSMDKLEVKRCAN